MKSIDSLNDWSSDEGESRHTVSSS
jgi:hypothetical protein